jgi:hypothetical protein
MTGGTPVACMTSLKVSSTLSMRSELRFTSSCHDCICNRGPSCTKLATASAFLVIESAPTECCRRDPSPTERRIPSEVAAACCHTDIHAASGDRPGKPSPLQHAQERRQSWENRVADQSTRLPVR